MKQSKVSLIGLVVLLDILFIQFSRMETNASTKEVTINKITEPPDTLNVVSRDRLQEATEIRYIDGGRWVIGQDTVGVSELPSRIQQPAEVRLVLSRGQRDMVALLNALRTEIKTERVLLPVEEENDRAP